ncbi:MAG: allantoinase AllB [Tepidisphaeraceae bacterium]
MLQFDLIIRGGRVLTPQGERVLDIAVRDGRIAELSPAISAAAKEEISVSGMHVFPGLMDAHVHFNEPGRTEWEGFASGSAALAAGGGTFFIDMPLNASPPTLDAASFDAKKAAAEASSLTDFGLWGGLTPDNLDHLEELAERGVVGFKAFMCDSGTADFARADDVTLRRGMQIARRVELPVAVHAESQEITSRLVAEIGSRNARGWADFLASRPIQAEIDAIGRAVAIARESGCSLHVVHVSSSAGVEIVRRAREDSRQDVTCETCPHYLLLNEADLLVLGAKAKCAPPLRAKDENARLWELVREGAIQFVASDHSPAPPSMKSGDDAMKIWGGIAGVQSTLLSMLGREGLPPTRVAGLVAERVARRFRLNRKGRIALGCDADLTLVGLAGSTTLSSADLLDRHKFSPYAGRTFRGVIHRTIARGSTIFSDGRIYAAKKARLISPSREGGHD